MDPIVPGFRFQADGMTVEFPWVGDKLAEWDKETKEIAWSWSVFDHYNMSDYDHLGGTWTEAYISLHYDWTHVNADFDGKKVVYTFLQGIYQE